MKFQWTWLLGLLFAIIIAVFSVANVESVHVNYVFGTADWPLVLIILCSALLGAAISGIVAMFRTVMAKRQVKELLHDITAKEATIAAQQNELASLRRKIPKASKSSKNAIEMEDLLTKEGKNGLIEENENIVTPKSEKRKGD